jgi:hypothetical protein
MRSHFLAFLGAIGLLITPVAVNGVAVSAAQAATPTCPPGYVLNTTTNKCGLNKPKPTGNCPTGQTKADNGKCSRPTKPTGSCPGGLAKVNGKCPRPPKPTGTCPVGQSMVNGKCARPPKPTQCRPNTKAGKLTTGPGAGHYACLNAAGQSTAPTALTCPSSNGQYCSN